MQVIIQMDPWARCALLDFANELEAEFFAAGWEWRLQPCDGPHPVLVSHPLIPGATAHRLFETMRVNAEQKYGSAVDHSDDWADRCRSFFVEDFAVSLIESTD